LDRAIFDERLIQDDTIRIVSEAFYVAGKGIDVSRVIRELGGKGVAMRPTPWAELFKPQSENTAPSQTQIRIFFLEAYKSMSEAGTKSVKAGGSVTMVGIIANVFLILFKAFAGVFGHSQTLNAVDVRPFPLLDSPMSECLSR
jgi:hypothetical protein